MCIRDSDLVDDRGVHREGPLDPDTERHLADREGLADTRAVAADDDALEDLDTGAVAFDDLDVHLDGVAGAEVRDVVAQRGLVDVVEVVHRILLPCRATGRRCWVCRLGAGPGRAECLRSPCGRGRC